MGNDGGSIPTRRELVKEAARDPNSTELKETLQEQQAHNWTTCPLSDKPLLQPVVSDSTGRLYNKDAVLELILPSEDETIIAAKAQKSSILSNIKGIRDIVTVTFQADSDTSQRGSSRQSGQNWVCPITGKELGPKTKAVYLVPCGHAFSKIAITEIHSNTCIQCNEPFKPENVIPILSTSVAERQWLADRITKLRDSGLTHSLKKLPGGKKRKHGAVAESVDATLAIETKSSNGDRALQNTDIKAPTGQKTDFRQGIKDAATAALTAKVLAQEKELRKKRKHSTNENIQSLYTADTNSQSLNKTGDFMTRGYSIPTNAKR